MGERLERVVHENQLRPGLLVEVHDCHCGRARCRCLLLRSDRDGGTCDQCPDGRECLAWDTAPDCMGDGMMTCFAPAVGDCLYIVNPFADDAETTTKAKPRKRERTR
jgi:hypothetical protein